MITHVPGPIERAVMRGRKRIAAFFDGLWQEPEPVLIETPKRKPKRRRKPVAVKAITADRRKVRRLVAHVGNDNVVWFPTQPAA